MIVRERGRGQYGFLPIIMAAMPMITGMMKPGQDDTPPPPPPMNPLIIVAGATLGVAVLGGLAYAVLK